jgi:hypothetical protein
MPKIAMEPKVVSYTAVPTASSNMAKKTKAHTTNIDHIADRFGYLFDSTMMVVTSQKVWMQLSDVAKFT